MLTTLFGDIIDGKLRRRPFIGWLIFLEPILVLATLGAVVAIGTDPGTACTDQIQAGVSA